LIFIEIIAALVVFGFILVFAGNQAYLYDREFGHLTRTSTGFFFWLFLLGLYLFGIETAKETGISANIRILSLCYFLIVRGLFYLGIFQYLSIYKEYMNKRAIFIQEIRRHLFLSLGSVIAALAVSIPLSI
jgi:osmoprotectant transport system permease protein